jgi:hypothetical protein
LCSERHDDPLDIGRSDQAQILTLMSVVAQP